MGHPDDIVGHDCQQCHDGPCDCGQLYSDDCQRCSGCWEKQDRLLEEEEGRC